MFQPYSLRRKTSLRRYGQTDGFVGGRDGDICYPFSRAESLNCFSIGKSLVSACRLHAHEHADLAAF